MSSTLTNEDTATNANTKNPTYRIPGYRITVKDDHVDLMGKAIMFFSPLEFACSKCGATVSVSERKAAKLRKRKRVTILCKKCKKAQKARRRG